MPTQTKPYNPYAWMTNEKGAGGITRGTSLRVTLLLNEQEVPVSPARCSQLATAAVCTEQHQMEEASCSQSYRMQLREYDEGLQRTPELERRQQSCVACRFLHESTLVWQQQKKSKYHTSKEQTTTTTAQGLIRLKLQRSAAAAAAVVVVIRAPSPQTKRRDE